MLIDDTDVSDVLRALARKAKAKNINLDFDQFNVGSQRLPELIDGDGKLDISKVIQYYKIITRKSILILLLAIISFL